MRNFRYLPMALLLPTLFSCSRVKSVHRLDSALALDQYEGVRLDRVYLSPQFRRLRDKTIVVRLDDIASSTEGRRKAARGRDLKVFGENLEKFASEALWRTQFFRDVGRDEDNPPITDPEIVFDVAMTEWNEGSAPLRGILWFGAGKTRMQMEGVFRDARTGETLMAFADARAHPGYSIYRRSTWRAEDLIREDSMFLVSDLQQGLFNLFDEPWPKGGPGRKYIARPARRDPDETKIDVDKLIPPRRPTATTDNLD